VSFANSIIPTWIAADRHGEMRYMEARDDAGELKRASLASVRTVGTQRDRVCAQLQHRPSLFNFTTNQRPGRGWISRYAWTREDYHDAILRRLRQVEAAIQNDLAHHESLSTEHSFRSYVDTGPLIERVYAKYAGIGWIAKNTCIINQKLGSWLFLGVILSSLELESDLPAPDRCGSCHALYRRLPHARVCRTRRTRCPFVHFVSDHREAR